MAAPAFTEIPEVDLGGWSGSPTERAALADRVLGIAHEIGFFQLVGHGIDQTFLDAHVDHQRRLFALADEHKEAIDKARSPHFRGWERVGAELTGGHPDLREQIDLSSENPIRGLRAEPAYLRLDGPNQWPDDTVLPGFRTHMADYFHRMASLADTLLDVISLGLGLDEAHLRTLFGPHPLSLVKLISYPPTPPGGAGVNPHHDAGFLTLLYQHDAGGLQALNPDDRWIDIPPRRDAFVVNLGEMLQEMSGNYVVATTHRVIADEPRSSSAWFHGPDLETQLRRLPLASSFSEAVATSPRHAAAGFMARRGELEAGVDGIGSGRGAGVYGQQLWNYYCRSYPDNVMRHHPDAAG